MCVYARARFINLEPILLESDAVDMETILLFFFQFCKSLNRITKFYVNALFSRKLKK